MDGSPRLLKQKLFLIKRFGVGFHFQSNMVSNEMSTWNSELANRIFFPL